MTDALLPLRCAYGAEVPGEPAAPPSAGAPGHAEWSLLAQMRDLLERRPAAAPDTDALEGTRLDALRATLPVIPAHGPSPAAVEAVEAYAAEATLAAVRHAYGETDGAAPGTPVPTVEAALLAQSREVLERAPRAAGPSTDVLAAVLARAAEASGAPSPVLLAVVRDPLVAIRAVYGPRLISPDVPVTERLGADRAVEAALLSQMRDLLERGPREVPSDAAVAAVLARAAEAVPPESSPAAAPVAPAGLRRPAPSRRAAAPPRTLERRLGRWAGATALLGAAVVALLVGGPAVFNGLPGIGSDAAPAAESALIAGAVPAPPADALDPTSSADDEFDAAAPPLSPDAFAGALTAADTPGAPAPRGPAAPVVAPPTAAAAPSAARVAAPSVASSAAPTMRLAAVPSARQAAGRSDESAGIIVPPPPPPAAEPPRDASSTWDTSGGLRTISMRVSALRRTTGATDWDRTPAEAFGAPRTPVTMSITPGVQTVRTGAARARVLSDTTDSGD